MLVEEQIQGILTKIRYQNEEESFSIAEVQMKDGGLVTIVGNIAFSKVGEALEVIGKWETHSKFGKQFSIISLHSVLPVTIDAIEKYLSSGLIDGIGPVLAKRIVGHFLEKTLEIIDEDSQRIQEVSGIGKIRAARIAEAWKTQRAIRYIMMYLNEVSLSPALAEKIYKHYGAKSVAILRENPYILAKDLYGVGFKKADLIAQNTGVKKTSPYRIHAALDHLLRKSSHDGHVYLKRNVLLNRVSELLGIDNARITIEISNQIDKGHLVEEAEKESYIFSPTLWKKECENAFHLLRLAKSGGSKNHERIQKQIERIEKKINLVLANSQRKAVESAWLAKVSVITGGPGTGKTTIIRAITEIAKNLGRQVVLCAPTGRAAKRLSEATRMKAMTIHRLLDFSFQEGFRIHEKNKLVADMLIVDEASMIDNNLLAALLSALPDPCSLVIVGDVDQLPSVGPGKVLEDIIESGVLKVVQLKEIFRQAQQSDIVLNAHRINQGLPIKAAKKESDFFSIRARSPQDAQNIIVNLVTKRLPSAYGVNPFEDIQILSPMYRGEIGCTELNARMQAALIDPSSPSIQQGGILWKVGDKVMQLSNDYELDIYNGDIGRLIEIDKENEKLGVMFEDRLVWIPFLRLSDLRHAYAITVHKSQGSEYPVVILPVMTQHYLMLQRNLLYTALTRAKQLVVIVGTANALNIAINNASAKTRNTRLSWRLMNEF